MVQQKKFVDERQWYQGSKEKNRKKTAATKEKQEKTSKQCQNKRDGNITLKPLPSDFCMQSRKAERQRRGQAARPGSETTRPTATVTTHFRAHNSRKLQHAAINVAASYDTPTSTRSSTHHIRPCPSPLQLLFPLPHKLFRLVIKHNS